MGLLEVEKFLCIFELRTGAKIIGYVTLASKSLMVILVSLALMLSSIIFFKLRDVKDPFPTVAFSSELHLFYQAT